MTLKIRIIRWLIAVLNEMWPFIVRDVVIGPDRHVAYNPNKRPKERQLDFSQPVGTSHTARMAGGAG